MGFILQNRINNDETKCRFFERSHNPYRAFFKRDATKKEIINERIISNDNVAECRYVRRQLPRPLQRDAGDENRLALSPGVPFYVVLVKISLRTMRNWFERLIKFSFE